MSVELEGPRKVLVAGCSGSPLEAAARILSPAGFSVVRVVAPEALTSLPFGPVPDLVIVDQAFGPEGGVLFCRSLRESPAWHGVSMMVVIPAGTQHLEECLVSGINDFILSPFPDEELLNKARRLTVIPVRREMNTLVRVREVREGGRSYLGKTLNVSANGLLMEVESALDIGRIVELEFFLPADTDPVRSRGQVARRARELDVYHEAFGVRFLELTARDRERIKEFVARRDREGSAQRSGTESA